MKYIIREMHPNENFLLEDFLYQAIYQPDKTNLAPRSIIKQRGSMGTQYKRLRQR